jgi:DNA-binding NarL/FixJ family response regulator
MVRVMVIAESPAMAELVAGALREERRVDVIRVVGDRRQLPQPAAQEAPTGAQVVVYFPGAPIETLPWREAMPGAGRVLVIADFEGHVGLERALRLGARGYVGPGEPTAVLARRVLQAAEGELAVPVGAVAAARATLRQLAREDPRLGRLDEVERRIVRWLAGGETAKEIAVRLKIELSAAYGRTRRLREKLGFRTDPEMTAWAGMIGLYPEDEEPAEGPLSR